MNATTARAVCADHSTTNPCPGCRADHLAGDHATTPHKATCRMCRAEARAPRLTAPHRPNRVLPDVAALAANDTDLLEE